jgi:hypothetical protein
MSCRHPVVDMTPVIRRSRVRVDADRLDAIDMPEHAFDLRPAVDFQQDFAAWAHEGQRLVRFARLDRAHDVDARDDRAEVVGRPSDEGEYCVGPERDDTPPAVEICSRASRPNLIQYSIFARPCQLDMGQVIARTC